MDLESIKVFRQRIKDSLEGFSSIEMQEREWITKADTTVWFWDEALNGYFDDAFMADGKSSGLRQHVKDRVLTFKEADLIMPFNQALERYAIKVGEVLTLEDCKKILKDPEWIKITEMAKEILEKIDFDKLPEEQENKEE